MKNIENEIKRLEEIIENEIIKVTDDDYTIRIENLELPTSDSYGFFEAFINFNHVDDEDMKDELFIQIFLNVRDEYEPADIFINY